jgi:hypothetical protein
MDISTITDINQLKALAYDQTVARDQSIANLVLIENRIKVITSGANSLPNAPSAELPAGTPDAPETPNDEDTKPGE